MSDGSKTTTGETRKRAAGLALGLLLCAASAAHAAPPVQELAGPSRVPPGAQASERPATTEHPAERLPPITFPPGSASLTPSATRVLDSVGRSLADDRLRLECHSGANRDLAGRRADAVAGYLQQNFGVQRDRIEVVTAAEADDRRVFVEYVGQ